MRVLAVQKHALLCAVLPVAASFWIAAGFLMLFPGARKSLSREDRFVNLSVFALPPERMPLRSMPNSRLSHFQMSWRHLGWRRACVEVARAIAGDSVIFARPDNAAFDMTVHSASRYNQVRVMEQEPVDKTHIAVS